MVTPARFHVHLTVKVSVTGAHVGRITSEPLLEQEAVAFKDAYAANILAAESVVLSTIEYGKHDTVVFPIDVLRRSVLLFELKEVVLSPPNQNLDFGSNFRKRQPDREI